MALRHGPRTPPPRPPVSSQKRPDSDRKCELTAATPSLSPLPAPSAVAATATACQGRGRDGRVPFTSGRRLRPTPRPPGTPLQLQALQLQQLLQPEAAVLTAVAGLAEAAERGERVEG